MSLCPSDKQVTKQGENTSEPRHAGCFCHAVRRCRVLDSKVLQTTLTSFMQRLGGTTSLQREGVKLGNWW